MSATSAAHHLVSVDVMLIPTYGTITHVVSHGEDRSCEQSRLSISRARVLSRFPLTSGVMAHEALRASTGIGGERMDG